MPVWTPLFNSKEIAGATTRKSAMFGGKAVKSVPGVAASKEIIEVANSLMLHIPGVEFSFEVDVAGRHRITVHFKGIDIAVDEGQEGA